jgi:hypothetical protein
VFPRLGLRQAGQHEPRESHDRAESQVRSHHSTPGFVHSHRPSPVKARIECTRARPRNDDRKGDLGCGADWKVSYSPSLHPLRRAFFAASSTTSRRDGHEDSQHQSPESTWPSHRGPISNLQGAREGHGYRLRRSLRDCGRRGTRRLPNGSRAPS